MHKYDNTDNTVRMQGMSPKPILGSYSSLILKIPQLIRLCDSVVLRSLPDSGLWVNNHTCRSPLSSSMRAARNWCQAFRTLHPEIGSLHGDKSYPEQKFKIMYGHTIYALPRIMSMHTLTILVERKG